MLQSTWRQATKSTGAERIADFNTLPSLDEDLNAPSDFYFLLAWVSTEGLK